MRATTTVAGRPARWVAMAVAAAAATTTLALTAWPDRADGVVTPSFDGTTLVLLGSAGADLTVVGCDGADGLLVDGDPVLNDFTGVDTLCSEVVGIDADLGGGDDRFDVRGLGGLPILNVVDVDGGPGTDGWITDPGVGVAGNPVAAGLEVTVYVGTPGADTLLADPGQPEVNGAGVAPLVGTSSVVLDGAGGDDTYRAPLGTLAASVAMVDDSSGSGDLLSAFGTSGVEITTLTTTGVNGVALAGGLDEVVVDGSGGSDTWYVPLSDPGLKDRVVSGGAVDDTLVGYGVAGSQVIEVEPGSANLAGQGPLTATGFAGLIVDGGPGDDRYDIDRAVLASSQAQVSDGVGTDTVRVLGTNGPDTFDLRGDQVDGVSPGPSFEVVEVAGLGGDDTYEIDIDLAQSLWPFEAPGGGNDVIVVNGTPGADEFDMRAGVPRDSDVDRAIADGLGGSDTYTLSTAGVSSFASISDSGAGDTDTVVVVGGGGADVVPVTGSTVGGATVPAAIEAVTIDGAGGGDTTVVALDGLSTDIAWTVRDLGAGGTDSVELSGTGAISLQLGVVTGSGRSVALGAGLDRVELVGSGGADQFTVAGGTGIALVEVTGGGGTDSLAAPVAEGVVVDGPEVQLPGGTLLEHTGVEQRVLSFTNGPDTTTIAATPSGVQTTLQLGAGDDRVTVLLAGLAGPLDLADGGGADTVVVRGRLSADRIEVSATGVALAGTTRSLTFVAGIEVWGIEGWEGADEIVVTATPGATVTLDGGNGNDRFEIATPALGANISVSDPGGTDALDVAGDDSSETFTVSGAGIVTGGRTVDVGTGIEAVTLDARGGNDDVIASPSATATIDLEGGPGSDTLRVASNDLAVTTGPGRFDTAGRQRITHSGFEVVRVDDSVFIGTQGDDDYTIFSTTETGTLIDLLGGSDRYTTFMGSGTGLIGPARLDDSGLVGTDVVRVIVTSDADALTLSGGRLVRNGAEVVELDGIEELVIEAAGGDDVITIDGLSGLVAAGLADGVPGASITIRGGGGVDRVVVDAGGRAASRSGSVLRIAGLPPITLEGVERLDVTGAVERNPSYSLDGYWLVATDGGIFAYGDAPFLGSTGDIRLNQPIVGMAATPSGAGYWLVASDGGIFAYGDAQFFGSTGDIRLNQPIVGMAATPSGAGYWLVASDGGIFAFGDAQFFGSTGDIRLNQPIVGMAATPSGSGYWLVASDGGIFAFGDAQFFGSTGAITLAQPIEGIAAVADGSGYWMVASDGGIFAFGTAVFSGSAVGEVGSASVTSIEPTPTGGGYWVLTDDGQVFNFGDAPFRGQVDGPLSRPVVGGAANQ